VRVLVLDQRLVIVIVVHVLAPPHKLDRKVLSRHYF